LFTYSFIYERNIGFRGIYLDLGKNLEDAFDFTKKMSEDAGRWIILIILSIIPIVNFITVGYAAKVIKDTPNSSTPPR
jgi:hypothetical protein